MEPIPGCFPCKCGTLLFWRSIWSLDTNGFYPAAMPTAFALIARTSGGNAHLWTLASAPPPPPVGVHNVSSAVSLPPQRQLKKNKKAFKIEESFLFIILFQEKSILCIFFCFVPLLELLQAKIFLFIYSKRTLNI